MRTFVIAALLLAASFAVPHPTKADTSCTKVVNGQTVTGILVNGVCSVTSSSSGSGSCGSGGTCKANCAATETEAVAASFACQTTPFASKCCVPTNTICRAPAICQSGPTASFPTLNPDTAINCGSTDKCYLPAATTVTPPPGGGGSGSAGSPPKTTGGSGTAGIAPPSGSSGGTAVFLNNPLKGPDCSKTGDDCLMAFLQSILAYVIRIGTIIVILMMVFVGYKFVVAQGNPTAIEDAKKMLLWTVVGALILLGSQAIAMGIKATVETLGGS